MQAENFACFFERMYKLKYFYRNENKKPLIVKNTTEGFIFCLLLDFRTVLGRRMEDGGRDNTEVVDGITARWCVIAPLVLLFWKKS